MLCATTIGTTSRVDIEIALVKGEMAGSTRNLVGRRHECEELDEVVARARAGNSPVLALRGGFSSRRSSPRLDCCFARIAAARRERQELPLLVRSDSGAALAGDGSLHAEADASRTRT